MKRWVRILQYVIYNCYCTRYTIYYKVVWNTNIQCRPFSTSDNKIAGCKGGKIEHGGGASSPPLILTFWWTFFVVQNILHIKLIKILFITLYKKKKYTMDFFHNIFCQNKRMIKNWIYLKQPLSERPLASLPRSLKVQVVEHNHADTTFTGWPRSYRKSVL